MQVLDVVIGVVLVLHLLAMAGIVGGWLATVRAPRLTTVMVHSALTSLVTGLLLVGLTYANGEGDEIDNVKITVKLLVALTIAVLAWINRKRESVPETLVTLIGVLGVTNVFVAVLWK